MTVAIVIPARFGSTRFPGKPLVQLKSADGTSKSLIQRSWEAAQAVRGVAEIVVATDDERIARHVEEFGGRAIMTPQDCANGTERCAAARPQLKSAPEIVVNLQGDAPLTPAWFIEEMIEALVGNPEMGVATPVLRCDSEAYSRLIEDRAHGRVGGTTAVVAVDGTALYFSKEVIPYVPEGARAGDIPVFHHVGAYAYRSAALRRYAGWPEGPLEAMEGLEQLRFVENGEKILCVEVASRGRVFWELNNPIDIQRIESVLA